MSPLSPDDSATLPPDELPPRIKRLPCVAPLLLARRITCPPTFILAGVVVFPACNKILPVSSFKLCPDLSDIEPDEPVLTSPVDIEIDPLVSPDPCVLIATCPLDSCPLPLINISEPP